MAEIESLFIESKGQPVLYKGRLIQMADKVSVEKEQGLRLEFEVKSSEWRQGVSLSSKGGLFECNGQTIPNGVLLWYETAPRVVRLRVKAKKGEILVKNVWDTGDGTAHSWHNDAAMMVEEIPSGRRYICNEGSGTDDFDDLVFTLTLE